MNVVFFGIKMLTEEKSFRADATFFGSGFR